MFESKFYNQTVGQNQVEKFVRDLQRLGMSYAIFVSISSPIANKKRVHYEMHGHCHTLYVSCSGSDSSGLTYAVIISILFMKNL